MLIFLFIAISFMVKVESEKQEMEDVVLEYRDTKVNINEELYSEFENDLEDWNASITNNNSIVFFAPEVLFSINKSELKNEEYALLLIDIAEFKVYNQLYGTNYGDYILKEFAIFLKAFLKILL